MSEPRWTLIVHGGAKTIAADRADANRAGCRAAAEAGAAILADGGSAVDAVDAAIRLMEDDATFNAGYGAVPNDAGEIELDAAIMRGDTLAVGAVAAARTIAHPISAARRLLDEPPILLVGEGADRYAAAQGLEPRDDARSSPSADSACDTVGCVARDLQGRLAAGTSTGGLDGQWLGRVGDSPMPGCGFYADDAIGAVSLSGDGEAIARVTMGARLMFTLEIQPIAHALEQTLERLERVGGEAGMIALDREGRPGILHNSDHFALAIAASDVSQRAAIHRDEIKDLLDHD